MPKISCIIAAYNEEPRIENILKAAVNHPLISEIIVVDDGSKDNTKAAVKKYDSVRLIEHKKNAGKNQAVVTGISASTGDFIFLLDADLTNLTPKNITDLIKPVLSNKADISISLRKNAPYIYKKIGLDFISGERVFPKKLVENRLEGIKKIKGYGLEVYLNKLLIKNNYKIKVVEWENVLSPWKYKKVGLISGIIGEIKMSLQILKTISIFEVIYQIKKMISLKI